jgi:hypothetical protein
LPPMHGSCGRRNDLLITNPPYCAKSNAIADMVGKILTFVVNMTVRARI